jgi:hypothetical protein
MLLLLLLPAAALLLKEVVLLHMLLLLALWCTGVEGCGSSQMSPSCSFSFTYGESSGQDSYTHGSQS